jgi:hypothetical protein
MYIEETLVSRDGPAVARPPCVVPITVGSIAVMLDAANTGCNKPLTDYGILRSMDRDSGHA